MSLFVDLASRRANGHDLWQHGWTPLGGRSTLDQALEGETRRTASGESVTPERALALSAYFAALRNISQDVAKLPRQVRRRKEPRGSEQLRDHPVARLLRRPNPLMTWMDFCQVMQFRVPGWGNAYAEITRHETTDEPMELWPVHPARIRPVVQKDARSVVYEWRRRPGDVPIPMPSKDILHLKAVGSGIEGLSLLRAGAEVLGIGLAAQKNAGRFFSENMAKRVVVFSKAQLGAAGRKALRQRILEDKQQDPEGRRKLPIIEGDYTVGDMGIPPEDAQLLESREFTTEEIGRLVRIALVKIQYHKRAQGWTSLELLNTDHAIDTLMPWCLTWEEELALKLFEEEERENHFVKIDLRGLLRGDTAARVSYYDSGLRGGYLSQNDVRELEDLEPIDDPGADEYRVQAQMRDTATTPPAPGAKPKPTLPVPPDGTENEDEGEEDEEDDRKRARQALAPVFLDAATRVVQKEAHALARAATKHAANAAAFGAWASDFYGQLRADAALIFEPAIEAARSLGAPAAASACARDAIAHGQPVDGAWGAYARAAATEPLAARAQRLADRVLDVVLPESPRAA